MNHFKTTLLFFVFCFFSLHLTAQYGPQFDNRGFENWTTREIESVSEPVHWHSSGTATGSFAGFLPDNQVEQSSQTRPGSSGSKSVRIYPGSVLGITANGTLTNGRINAGSMSATGSGNYNYTQRSQNAFNTPITQCPDSLTIWVCFRSQSTSHKAQVKAVVHGDADYQLIANGTESPANMHVATADQRFTRTAANGGAYNWTRLSIPFNNNGPCTDVRYILFMATTNETPGTGSTNDDLFVDDVLLVYTPSLSMGQLASTSFSPNDAITIPFTLSGTMSPENLNGSANQVIAQLSDASGNFNNPTELGRVTTNTSGSITATIPNVAVGSGYRIRVISTNYPLVGGNIQTVSIGPNALTITATAEPSNGGTVSGAGNYDPGATCTLTATANTGYTFVNWTKDGNHVSTNATFSFTVTESAAYVAHFSANSYTINVTANPSNGGTVTGGGTYTYGQSCTVSATAASGYSFVNWRENGNHVTSQAEYTFTVTGDRNLEARFDPVSFNITATADPVEGGNVTGGGNYQYGSTCTLTATTNTGYTFVNWTKNGTQVSTNATYSFTVTESATYVAHFSANSYTISVTANPSNGGTVTGGGSYTYGQSCTVSATAAQGYSFVNWRENGNHVTSQAEYTFTVTSDRDLEAHFGLQSFEITATADPVAGGNVTGGGNYTYGQSCTIQATPAAGYTFINWTENGSQVSTQASFTFTVESNRNFVAHFSSQSYIITASAEPAEGGRVTGSGGYDFGDLCTLTATANEGYTFVNWTKGGSEVSTEPTYSFTVTESATYVAHFSINSYEIGVTADPSEGGIVTGAGNYAYGTSCTLTATANGNYEFISWTKDGIEVSTEAIYSFTVTDSEDYVAHFRYEDDVEEHTSISQIFPNPFKSTLSITAESTIKSVRVYDAYGRLVMEQNVDDTHLDLDLSEFNAGVYLLQLDYGDSRSVHRIMKAE